MASEIDICNLALSHLGDTATVASINPPEGSAQAEHCSRFYPVARNALLEMHAWGFATKRIQLALLSSGWPEWNYSYAQPGDAVNILAVLPPSVTDDNVAAVQIPQPFSCEVDAGDAEVIYTDQADAVLRYTAIITDTTKFSPLFVTALSHHLAGMLAGPIIKGDVGAAEAKRQEAMMQYYLTKAIESDASQRRVKIDHIPASIAARG